MDGDSKSEKQRSKPPSVSRRAALAGASAAVLLSSAQVRAQEATPIATPVAAPDNTVGIGSGSENSIEFLGTVQQRGLEFSLTGYLTRVAGLDSAAIFSGPDPFARSESDALLTIVANASAVARSVLQNIFVIDAEGTFAIHAGTGNQSFEDPASFSAGALVTSGALSIQNVINVQAPQQGVSNGFGEFVTEIADPFLLGSLTVQLSAPGTRHRLAMTGQGTLHNPETLEATILVAGNLVAVG